MADLHIHDFYHDVAHTLLRLYAAFPRKSLLMVEDILGPDETDEFGLHSPRFEACFSAMVWLQEHDYLACESHIRNEALDQVVLTRRAFLLLSLPVDAPESSADFTTAAPRRQVDIIRAAVRERSSNALEACVRALLSRPPVGER